MSQPETILDASPDLSEILDSFGDAGAHMKRLIEQQANPEPLLPELERYVTRSGDWMHLNHPLVNVPMLTPMFHADVNAQLIAKKAAVVEAAAEGNWMKLLMLYERPSRMQAFIDYMDQMTPRQFWKNLGWVWTDSETPSVNFKYWKLLFEWDVPHRDFLMDIEERQQFRKLPDTFTVYRGAPHRFRKGLSWTLDRSKAVWFSKRNREPGHVYRATVPSRKHVIALFLGRNEKEIVIDPANLTDITRL